MPKNCLSVIGGDNLPRINQAINAAGGPGEAQIVVIDDVLATCELTNFGIINGEFCSDKCVFPELTDDYICATVLHECQSGVIIDWRATPHPSVTCNDQGQLCADLSCWKLPSACDNEPVDIDYSCADPCKIYHMIKNTRIRLMLEPFVVSWKTANKSTNYCKPNIPELKALEAEYLCACRDQQCMNQSQLIRYQAPRPC